MATRRLHDSGLLILQGNGVLLPIHLQANRARAPVPSTISSRESSLIALAEHRGAYWLIVNRLLAELELQELADNCGQKPERLWFGNSKAEVQTNKEFEPVPDFLLEDIAYEEASNFNSSDLTDVDIKRCQWLLKTYLRPSEDGEYETYYVPVMAASAGIGEPMFDSWVEWVLKGHHGEKNENIQPFKWRGLGNYSGHTTLYSRQKQDPDWARKLPDNLRFGALGAAAGYTEFDPFIILMSTLIQWSRRCSQMILKLNQFLMPASQT